MEHIKFIMYTLSFSYITSYLLIPSMFVFVDLQTIFHV
jgi:hypothetical protein